MLSIHIHYGFFDIFFTALKISQILTFSLLMHLHGHSVSIEIHQFHFYSNFEDSDMSAAFSYRHYCIIECFVSSFKINVMTVCFIAFSLIILSNHVFVFGDWIFVRL